MTLGSTQPVTELSTRNISWRVKAAGVYRLLPYHLHVPIVIKSGWNPQGLSRLCPSIIPINKHPVLVTVLY